MEHNSITNQKRSIRNWKMIIPLLTLFLCLSCNKDDDSDGEVPTIPTIPSFVKVKIGETQYTFNQFVVETQTVVEPDYSYVDLMVTGKIAGDDSKEMIMSLEQDATGTDVIYYFYVRDGEIEYNTDTTLEMFPTNVEINANKRIIGTFSGPLKNFDETQTIQLQNGTFDITY